MKTDKQEAMTKKEQIIEVLYKRRDEFIAQRKKIKASETSEDIRSLDDAIQTILTYIPPEYFDILNVDPVNKWIRIESEDDLPKESGKYFIVKDGSIDIGTFNFDYKKWISSGQYYFDTTQNIKITHYQPIKRPFHPIY